MTGFLVTLISVGFAAYILTDARKRGVAVWWMVLAVFGALFLPIIAVPVYFMLRPQASSPQPKQAVDPRAPVTICSKCGAEYSRPQETCSSCGNALSL